jgi:hypothetical protein
MHFAQQHVIGVLIAWYAFSAAVSALPSPLPNERWYQFCYVMAHTLAGSLARAGASMYPQAFKGATVQSDTITVTQTSVDTSRKQA